MTIFLVVHSVACLTILFIGLCNLNRMTEATNFWIRVAVVLVTSAGFSGFLATVFQIYIPTIGDMLLSYGVALGMISDRRQSLCPCAFATMHQQDKGDHNHGI
jgi:hypothetical protein